MEPKRRTGVPCGVGKKRTIAKAARRLEKLDRTIARRARKAHKHPAARLAHKVSEIADQPPLFAIGAATLAGGLLLRRQDLARTGVRMLLAEGLATGIKSVIKRSVDRSRPHHGEAKGKRYKLEPGDDKRSELSSFPSGHTAGAVAVGRAIAAETPELAPAAHVGAGAIAAAQLPVGAHYVGDLAAGAVIGWLAEAITGALFERLAPARGSAPAPADQVTPARP